MNNRVKFLKLTRVFNTDAHTLYERSSIPGDWLLPYSNKRPVFYLDRINRMVFRQEQNFEL